MNKRRHVLNLMLAIVMALVVIGPGARTTVAAPVTLTMLSMAGLTNNNATNTAIGISQLSVEVQCDSAINVTANQVSFIFRNSGASDIKIHEVYFDDDLLLKDLRLRDADDSVNGIFGESGVDYSPLANPANVPGENGVNPAFSTTTGFSADTDTPQPNVRAVGPGESLTVFFTLMNGKTCANVLSDLQTGKLRIAQHVGSFPNGGSESFINNPPPPPNTAPSCTVSGNVFTITDAEGLGTIVASIQTNVTTNPALPLNANGATNVQVTASVIDLFVDAALQLTVTDLGNLTANCNFSQSKTPDTAKPYCALVKTGTDAVSGKKFIQVKVQDGGSGLLSVQATKANNLDSPLSSSVGAFVGATLSPGGFTGEILVTAYKTNQTLASQLELKVTDRAGNVTLCDPVHDIVVREAGKPVTKTYSGVPAAEGVVTLTNGTPGVNRIDVTVNGTAFRVTGMKAGQVHTLDVASAMVAGDNNVFTVTAYGKPGANVDLLIWDGIQAE